jgi:hypothetical protein
MCVGWDGTLRFAARYNDYTTLTETRRDIDETRMSDVRQTWPSREQIGAPYNRVTLENLRTSRIQQVEDPFAGPYDDPGGTVSTWGQAIERMVNSKWIPIAKLKQDPWGYRAIEAKPRTVLTCRYSMDGLLLELGDYVSVSWTRNLGDPYTGTTFQIIGIAYDPVQKAIDLEMLWQGDLADSRPFLLDDETYLTKSTGSGGRTATVTDGSSTVTLSSGSVITDGVAVGDILVLKDTTESAGLFKRNKAVNIIQVVGATELRVSDPLDALDFDAPGGTAVSSWEIRASHLTYPTSITDPANYPDGANMYGRLTDNSGVHTAAGTGLIPAPFYGNRLFEG